MSKQKEHLFTVGLSLLAAFVQVTESFKSPCHKVPPLLKYNKDKPCLKQSDKVLSFLVMMELFQKKSSWKINPIVKPAIKNLDNIRTGQNTLQTQNK